MINKRFSFKRWHFSYLYIALLSLSFLSACSAPRNIIHTGSVTEKGHFVAGGNMSYNVPTATANALFGSLDDAIEKTLALDSIILDSSFNEQIKALAIYSIDPIGINTDFYARYGIINNMDIGYARSSGVNVFDARYQFLKSNNNYNGSIGLQYSSQSYELPSYLGKLQSLLKYELKRKDILIPIAFSKPFGEKEKYGALGYGIVYGRTWIDYDYKPNVMYELVSGEIKEVNDVPQGKTSFNTYGLFLNLKTGYKHFYGLLGLAGYYQNYGTYNLFQNQYADFSGITIVPNLGIQLVF